MLTDLVLRRAEIKDIKAMIDLISVVFAVEEDFAIDDAKQQCGLEMFFAFPEGRYLLVADYQGEVIGMCSAQLLISTAEGGFKALVEDVAVKEEFRGKGIGKAMLAAIADWAMSQGAKRLDLLADKANMRGLMFYDKLNWHKTKLIALQKKDL